jgi:dipeptidyl aminopeptidase/acylaminoacyl peptidase
MVTAGGCNPASQSSSVVAGEGLIPFGSGTLATVNGLAFTPDGRSLFVSRGVDGVDYRGRRRARIFRHDHIDGQWSAPVAVAFSRDFTDYQPVLNVDGSRLYFTSTRPLPGTTQETRQNIWYVDRTRDGWGVPYVVGDLATPGWDGYAVPVRNGRLYFVSERPGGRGAVDIWRADPNPAGGFHEPVNVSVLNSEHSDSDIYVDPEERFLMFHRSIDSTSTIDFWIAFRDGEAWLAPRRLDEVNGPGWELSPTVSPDGRYFFFTRDAVIYRIPFCALVRPDERRLLSLGRPALVRQGGRERPVPC